MTSGGFRLGAWDYLRWKHAVSLPNGMLSVMLVNDSCSAKTGQGILVLQCPFTRAK
jgi:hypothetical protein